MKKSNKQILSDLPSITKLLNLKRAQEISSEYGEGICKLALRAIIDECRESVINSELNKIPSDDEFLNKLEKEVFRLANPNRSSVVNATGILLHTGLGRGPLSSSALSSLESATRYSTVQVDLEDGGRSIREEKIEKMLRALTDCQAATIHNNNAASIFMLLNELSKDKEAIISRGQLIEIGGSFRMNEVMEASGSILREVGTTNKTHLHDYEKAINENTALIVYVHTSNFRIRGFTSTPSLEELVELGNKHNIPVIVDWGSGALIDISQFGLEKEKTVSEILKSGVAAVCFSGDKLLCGPQAGIVCGNKEIVNKIRQNPFARMFRVCKLTQFSLESTLVHYVNEDYCENIPLYKMLSTAHSELEKRARKIKKSLSKVKKVGIEIENDFSYIGGGSLPDEALKTSVLKIKLNDTKRASSFVERVAKSLRINSPYVFCRVKDQTLIFDMRSLIDDKDLDSLTQRLLEVLPMEVEQ